MLRWTRRLAHALTLAVGLVALPAPAQAPASEAEAKAKFAVTLARFIQWPAGAFASDAAPLRLCVLHDSPAVAAAFAGQRGQQVGGRELQVHLGVPAAPGGCELLFVDGSAARGVASLPGGELPVLTIGALDGFLSRGGMVELVNVNDALRFDVNLKALRAAHLGLSAQVLKLARQVRE